MITCQHVSGQFILFSCKITALILHLLLEYLTNKFNIPESTQLFYLILPSNDNLHFFIGSSTSMHRPPAEYDISLSPVKLVSGSDASSSNPISGIYRQRNTHVKKNLTNFNMSVHVSSKHQSDSQSRNKAELAEND